MYIKSIIIIIDKCERYLSVKKPRFSYININNITNARVPN